MRLLLKEEPLSVSLEATNIPAVDENCDQNRLDFSNTNGVDDPVVQTSAKDDSKCESIADSKGGVTEENVQNLFAQTSAKDDSEAK